MFEDVAHHYVQMVTVMEQLSDDRDGLRLVRDRLQCDVAAGEYASRMSDVADLVAAGPPPVTDSSSAPDADALRVA